MRRLLMICGMTGERCEGYFKCVFRTINILYFQDRGNKTSLMLNGQYQKAFF